MSSSRWRVYIVRCGDGSLYTGITTDIERRLGEHNEKCGSKYTRSRSPVRLAYQEFCPDRSRASKREAEIKRLSRKEKLTLIRNPRHGSTAIKKYS